MSEDQAIAMISGLGFLVLVSAALARRNLPGGTWLRLALIWGAIFAGVAIVATAVMRLTR